VKEISTICYIFLARNYLQLILITLPLREREAIVYALQKFFTTYWEDTLKCLLITSVLKYLVNKPVLGGRICIWLLLFQEYDFGIVVNPGRMNKGPDHLSRLEHGEELTILEDTLPDA
jgi:hypothetical protein